MISGKLTLSQTTPGQGKGHRPPRWEGAGQGSHASSPDVGFSALPEGEGNRVLGGVLAWLPADLALPATP